MIFSSSMVMAGLIVRRSAVTHAVETMNDGSGHMPPVHLELHPELQQVRPAPWWAPSLRSARLARTEGVGARGP
eukprot:CAMPEP_0119089168 /NCGR_PEP_ID=MMETSP1178-20130426/148127_1 /TAXON_ID=33656 /ORGANISM="unid sp, Strain CCMP2000" /LENGTH=73 /DNA_ID=CAMNT_0007072501 /DNA_START=62 /DNA_END=280 /DNA_ORIENTATION=+